MFSVIRKVDLVENLGGFVLDGFHLHQVWGVLPGPISENQARGKGAKSGGSHGKQRTGGTSESGRAQS